MPSYDSRAERDWTAVCSPHQIMRILPAETLLSSDSVENFRIVQDNNSILHEAWQLLGNRRLDMQYLNTHYVPFVIKGGPLRVSKRS
jgi:hypothetical protein